MRIVEGGLRMNEFNVNYERLLMTPGPTMIDERVRQAMARPIVNPDLDPTFFAQYRTLCSRIGQLMGTKNDVFILSAEGLLGLEAAVCSLVEPGTQVLVLANGYFGEGFGGFVEMYGGECIYLRGAYDQVLSAEEVEAVCQKYPNIRVATMVHCETPSGLLNPVAELVEPLKARGIITIVDAVASLGGEHCAADAWGVDVMLGGSQKVLSAPPGLALISISPAAWELMLNREHPIRSYYLNLLKWRELWLERSEFPYTPSISDIYALDKAVELLLAEGEQAVIDRHFRVAEATRNALRAAGLELFPQPGAEANTVTAFRVPTGIDEGQFRTLLWEQYGVMMAGSWGDLAGKIWRIGHMGYNARAEYMMAFFAAFEAAAKQVGIPLITSPLAAFAAQL
jgi:aspartate aminotransferase-like enzyme